MASIPVNMALEDALKARTSLRGKFGACAECLGFAADFLKDALDTTKKAGAWANFRVFEEFVADAQEMYGLTREECLDTLNDALRVKLFDGTEINRIVIDQLESAAGFTRPPEKSPDLSPV